MDGLATGSGCIVPSYATPPQHQSTQVLIRTLRRVRRLAWTCPHVTRACLRLSPRAQPQVGHRKTMSSVETHFTNRHPQHRPYRHSPRPTKCSVRLVTPSRAHCANAAEAARHVGTQRRHATGCQGMQVHAGPRAHVSAALPLAASAGDCGPRSPSAHNRLGKPIENRRVEVSSFEEFDCRWGCSFARLL